MEPANGWAGQFSLAHTRTHEAGQTCQVSSESLARQGLQRIRAGARIAQQPDAVPARRLAGSTNARLHGAAPVRMLPGASESSRVGAETKSNGKKVAQLRGAGQKWPLQFSGQLFCVRILASCATFCLFQVRPEPHNLFLLTCGPRLAGRPACPPASQPASQLASLPACQSRSHVIAIHHQAQRSAPSGRPERHVT